MAPLKTLCYCTMCACIFLFLGCKKESHPDAGQRLEQSFQRAEPEVKKTIAAVSSDLHNGKYIEAARTLEPVLAARRLTPQQKEDVGLLFQEISRAVAADPSIDSKELYEVRLKLFRAARGERF